MTVSTIFGEVTAAGSASSIAAEMINTSGDAQSDMNTAYGLIQSITDISPM